MLLGLPCWRDPQGHRFRKYGRRQEGGGMAQEGLRGRLLPRGDAPQDRGSRPVPGSLRTAEDKQRRNIPTGKGIWSKGRCDERRPFRGQGGRSGSRPPHMPQHRQEDFRRTTASLHPAGISQKRRGDGRLVSGTSGSAGHHPRNRRQSRGLQHRPRPRAAEIRNRPGIPRPN